MKKFLVSSLFLFLSCFAFAKTYRVEVKGEVFKKDAEGNLILLEEKTIVDDKEIIVFGDKKASIILFIDNNKIIIKNKEIFTIKELLEEE